MTMTTVVLERGAKGDRVYGPETEARAMARAISLAELHGCKFTVTEGKITVHATAFYS